MGSNWVMKRIVTIVLSVVSLGMATSLAADANFKEILAHVPRAELPCQGC